MKFTSQGSFRFASILITGCWTLAILLVWFYQYFGIGWLELWTYNLRFQQRGPLPPDDRVVLIAIDDGSIFGESLEQEEIEENPGYELLREFPYPRKAWALIIEKLVKAGARAVALDIIFSKQSPLSGPYGTDPEGKADDAALTQALLKYHDKVVIGANFTFAETSSDNPSQDILTKPHADLLPSEQIPDEEIVGFVNYMADTDGFIRRMNPIGWPFTQDKKKLPYSLDALAVMKAFPECELPLPFESRFIVFAGPGGTYNPIPLYLLFNTKSWQEDRPPLRGGKLFKDKIVLIGPRANFLHDDHMAPFGRGDSALLMPGPDIHVNAIATLLSNRNLKELYRPYGLLIIGILGIVYSFLLAIPKSPLIKVLPALGVGFAYSIMTQVIFQKMDLFIPFIPILILVGGSTASVVTAQAIVEQIEKRRVSGFLQRYVSKNVADELIKGGKEVDALLAPQKRAVTILFSDIRDFTTMTERNEPGPFVQQLNEYLTAMVELVFKNGGTLDKFVGDMVMAVYGNPTSRGKEEDAWYTVKTAVEMRHRLAELKVKWEKEGKEPFRFGIGIHHGDVMAGDIGSKQKAEFGIIGDPVNVAARVESLTKEQKVDILISDAVYHLVQDRIEVEPRGEMHVKGRVKPVAIYALLDLKESASSN